jgi:hypothetical protein
MRYEGLVTALGRIAGWARAHRLAWAVISGTVWAALWVSLAGWWVGIGCGVVFALVAGRALRPPRHPG